MSINGISRENEDFWFYFVHALAEFLQPAVNGFQMQIRDLKQFPTGSGWDISKIELFDFNEMLFKKDVGRQHRGSCQYSAREEFPSADSEARLKSLRLANFVAFFSLQFLRTLIS